MLHPGKGLSWRPWEHNLACGVVELAFFVVAEALHCQFSPSLSWNDADGECFSIVGYFYGGLLIPSYKQLSTHTSSSFL